MGADKSIDQTVPFSSIRCLTADALESAVSEQLENAFHHARVELSEWNEGEHDHIIDLIVNSPAMMRKMRIGLDAVKRGLRKSDPGFAMGAYLSTVVDMMRVTWHARGAIQEAPLLQDQYELSGPRQVERYAVIDGVRLVVIEMESPTTKQAGM